MELPIRVAVTLPIFEEFVREAGGPHVEVISLLPKDADPHSYELTSEDIERFRGVDFFFLNGLGLDSRFQPVIEANRDETAFVVPFAPNMRSPTGEGTAEEAGDNPHLWLDPSLAGIFTEIVADEFIIYDNIREAEYFKNFTGHQQRLRALQSEIADRLQAIPAERRKLVTFHDSFRHFARRFGLEVAGYAVADPGTPVSDEALQELARTVQERGVPAVFAEFGYDPAPMQEVADAAGVPLCTLISDIWPPDVTSYDQMMRANADELVRCLGG
jgi:ABC-type Zn uptake system ZnuABC Zn-binding protein ZnuA